VHARLLPHTAKDARRVPHPHQTLASLFLLLSLFLRFNSLFPDSTRIYLYLIPRLWLTLLRRGDSFLWWTRIKIISCSC
jgi:hypothetical protein